LKDSWRVSLRELIGVSPSIHNPFFAPFRVTAQFAKGKLPECMANSIVSVSNVEDLLMKKCCMRLEQWKRGSNSERILSQFGKLCWMEDLKST